MSLQVSILEDRRKEHFRNISEILSPKEGTPSQPEPSSSVRAVCKDLLSMHKQLQPLLTRQQLHVVFKQILGAFDSGLLEAYKVYAPPPLRPLPQFYPTRTPLLPHPYPTSTPPQPHP